MIYWVLLKDDTIGIFADFNYLYGNYDDLKDYLKPFNNLYSAYEWLCSQLTWNELFALGLDKAWEIEINQWISRSLR